MTPPGSTDGHDATARAGNASKRVARRRLAALAIAFGSTLTIVAGGPAAAVASTTAPPITVVDDRGITHRFDEPPRRLVTLLPSLTETAWVLGGGPRLVGVDRYSTWPAAIAKLPRLGGLDDAQIEAIVALSPDVVLASTSSRAVERLEALGLRVVRLKSETHADVRRSVDVVARLLGAPAGADRIWATIERELDAAAARVPPALRGQRVYFEIGGGPHAAGSASFIGETLARLGMGNVVPPELGPFPKLNPEYVVRARPDIVMGVQREIAALPQRPGFASLPAVREQRLCAFDAATYELLTRPGPRLGEAAAAVVDCLVRITPAAPR